MQTALRKNIIGVDVSKDKVFAVNSETPLPPEKMNLKRPHEEMEGFEKRPLSIDGIIDSKKRGKW